MSAGATTATPADARRDAARERERTAQLGMWVFLATEVLFFGGALFAYLIGRLHWPQGFAVASQHTNLLIGTANTAVLVTSSLTMALAVTAAALGLRRWIAPFLWATVALGVAFMVLKGLEYRGDWVEGLVPGAGFRLGDDKGAPPMGAELFYMLYWFLTVLHSVHLLIGIGITSAFAWGATRRQAWVQPPRVQIAGLYWSFVDIIWIILYPLVYLVQRHG